VRVSRFDDLVREGDRASLGGWDFTWLDGRAVEDRPSWRYFDRVAERVTNVAGVVELQAGTGSMIGRLPVLPALAVATEGFEPSLAIAAPRLCERHVHLVVTSQVDASLPFGDAVFDLAVSRHPVDVWWDEIARVLRRGGVYFAQHVGPHSLRDLAEIFVETWPERSRRDPTVEARAARAAGLVINDLRSERTRVAFYDIGAVVYFLRLVPWIVPGFSVDRYREELRRVHERIERDGVFETTSSRTLIDAARPA
jgi:SAM-dependent methyltransferase